MPDWLELVRQRLSGLALDSSENDEVKAELAGHLEETWERFVQQGLPEDEAVQHTLSEVKNWQDLRRRIQCAKKKENPMPDRVKQLWLPGLLGFVLSMAFLALLQIFGPKPWIVGWKGLPPVAVLYAPWILSLLPVGALGAYVSHRAGASQRMVIATVIFPVVPFFVAIAIVFPVSLLFNGIIPHVVDRLAILLALCAWVFLPGIALLAGGLPAQMYLSRRLASRRVVSS